MPKSERFLFARTHYADERQDPQTYRESILLSAKGNEEISESGRSG